MKNPTFGLKQKPTKNQKAKTSKNKGTITHDTKNSVFDTYASCLGIIPNTLFKSNDLEPCNSSQHKKRPSKNSGHFSMLRTSD